MTAAGKQWKAQELPLANIYRHSSFQMRVNGVDRGYALRLLRVLQDGGELPAIKVAKVGKALYVVDGFHRIQAHEGDGRDTIQALVAKMSLAEAQEEARLANTTHGKGLSRADKAKALAALIAAGGHLEANGTVKACRTIAAELNHIYSHETVRTKLKALGIELEEAVEFPHGRKPRVVEEDADFMCWERGVEAEGHLEAFRELFYSLTDDRQRELLGTARELVGALEVGERPERAGVDPKALPDI